MAAAIALSARGRGVSTPNPNVGCLIVQAGRIVGRGWTQAGGRPHAEAKALQQALDQAHGATAYVTLEPCFHLSPRGPRCVDLLIRAGVSRVVIAARDPDPRTDGQSIALLESRGIVVEAGLLADQARDAMAGFFLRHLVGRPYVTLKLAMSLDGRIALPNGTSRWITGPAARAHTHMERARHDAILVGAATVHADMPRLDVRLPGLEDRAPMPAMLGSGKPPDGWRALHDPRDIAELPDVNDVMVEGGAATAAAFLKHDLVDRLILYHAPILIGEGRASIGDLGLERLDEAHGRWRLRDSRMLGPDRLEVYARVRRA